MMRRFQNSRIQGLNFLGARASFLNSVHVSSPIFVEDSAKCGANKIHQCSAPSACLLCKRFRRNCGVALTSVTFFTPTPIQNQRRAYSTSSHLMAKNSKNTPSSQLASSAVSARTNTLHIGDVSLPIIEGNHPERIASGLPPSATAFFNPNRPETLRYIRWLAQKDLLQQDVCIVGDPGPTKRWLAMLFAQFAHKEVQLLCLSRDTTEADIKQRKEIRDGTLYYVNQAAVTAALEGQLLIIDGLERAERNVLPVINNLLENREMHLDNGMMLIAPKRYDQLCREHGVTDLTDWGLLRVSEKFRVIGLTVPVPKFSGNPLDPPLRSRFQCLYLDNSNSSGGSGSSSVSAAVSSGAPTHLTFDVIPKSVRGTQPIETMLKFRAVQNTVDNAGSDRDRLRSFPAVTDFDIWSWSTQHEAFPSEHIGELLQRVYPFELYIRNGPRGEQSVRRATIKQLMRKYALESEGCLTTVTNVEAAGGTATATRTANISFSDDGEGKSSNSRSASSSSGDGDDHSSFFTPAHRRALTGLLQSHTCGRHMALVGSAGCGKTNLIREFATLLGYEVETQHLFRDMSTRDLLQRRATDPITGSTTWELSPLMIAVKEGKLAVLDGIDQLSPGAMAVLQELLLDGNITLFDGSVFKNDAAFDELKNETLGLATDAEMNAKGIYRVHPSFRLIATSRYPTGDSSAKKVWLTSDLVPLLNWHILPDLEIDAVLSLLSNVTKRFASAYGGSSVSSNQTSTNLRASDVTSDELIARQSSKGFQNTLASLVTLQHKLAEMAKTENKTPTLTLRQLRHIAKHVLVFPEDLYGIVESSLLLPLLTQLVAVQVKNAMEECGIELPNGDQSTATSGGSNRRRKSSSATSSIALSAGQAGNPFQVLVPASTSTSSSDALIVCKSFGHEVMHITRKYSAKEQATVPHVPSFHANRLQLTLQAWIAKNIASGNNILLVGNQGVGKNKIVDQLLMQVGLPRQYLQLHRDTTVSSLTINPTVVEGKVMWEDSPLVKAVQQGHVLVVDEIDKAPVEVVHILKGLIEDREMRLGDGRRVSGWASSAEQQPDKNVIAIHPDFRVIVLANPPGFPFHGNDFYRECGDLFSCFVVQNPDPSSQQDLLQQIAPQVPAILITKLIMVFAELGTLFAAGTIQYPFSLRELIAVVRHLQAFPKDGLYQALSNVFSFDLLNENTMNHVRRLLHQYISPITQAQLRSGMGENLVAKEVLLGKLLDMATFSVQPAAKNSNTKAELINIESTTTKSLERLQVAANVSTVKVSYESLPTAPTAESNASSEAPFTERIAALDFSSLLKSGELVTGSRQISHQGGDGVNASTTIVITNKGRMMTLPTPTSQNGGAIAGVQGISLSGSSDNLASSSKVTIIQLPKALLNGFPSLLGTSAALADSVQSLGKIANEEKSTISSTSAADNSFVAHLLNSTTDGTELAITTVSVAGNGESNGHVTTVNFSNVTAACSRLAAEGCVAVATGTTATFLYYGRAISVNLGESFSKITRIDALSSQIFFIVGECSGTDKAPACGFLKLSAFRDRCEAFFHSAGFADMPAAQNQKKDDDVDTRKRITAAATLQLLVSEGLFAGFASGEGYVPTPGPLTYENIHNALFVLKSNGGRIEPKQLIYAIAKAEQASENGLVLVTFEGAVNRLDKPIQIASTAQNTISSGVASSSGSEWAKVGEHSSFSSSLTAPSSLSSHSALFGHHQLVARDSHSSTVHVVSSQKGTIRSFQTAAASSNNNAGLFGKAKSFFGSSSSQANGGAADGGGSGADVASADPSTLMTSVGSDGIGSTVAPSGALQSYDTNAERLNESYSRWNSVLKGGAQDLGQPPTPEELEMWYSKPKKQPNEKNLKHGEEDPDNTPHSGGSNWAGGTGGTDTAGLGGLVGPYRLDKGHPVTQVDPAEKKKVPQHIIDEARKMGKEALEKRLKEINMTVTEDERYREAFERVQGPVQQLQSMLEGLKSKEKERSWMRHQTDGVWDDAKLVEGVTGEKTVYKRRIEADENQPFGKPEHKKRLLFVMDVSASMYRFNGMDMRLTKSVECAVMIMEAFKGHEDKIDYSIIGHNGDSATLPLVPFGQPPTNKKQRMDVCMKMVAYSQFCWSGDNTVNAMEESIKIVTEVPADNYFVFVISDANLAQYGISPKHLSRIIKSNDLVNMFCIFIASLGQQAKSLQQQLPAGHGFECYDTNRLPIVLQQIFQATDVLN